jgi:hypothetical protein
MSNSQDISPLLREWPFDPQNNVRIVRAENGRDVLQVRLPLGIEQYALDGRPDGERPHNKETALDFFLGRLEKARVAGEEESFRINSKECGELFDEGVLFYCRYLHLFQLKDWARVARDTSRNLKLFDFVHRHALRKEDRNHLEQWRPYVLRMNAIARAMLEADQHRHDQALQIVRDAHDQIESLPEYDNENFRIERERALQALHEVVEQIEKSRPLSDLERLEKDLHLAIEEQEFERAAVLRDKIRALRAQ